MVTTVWTLPIGSDSDCAAGLELQPSRMQHGLCITRGLFPAFEHQIAGRLKRDRGAEVCRHGTIERIVRVLGINHSRHLLHRRHDLRLAGNPVVQPVGHVL